MDCTCGTEMLAMVPSVALVAMCTGATGQKPDHAMQQQQRRQRQRQRQ